MSKKIELTIVILLALLIIPVYWLKLAYYNPPVRDGLYLIIALVPVIASFFAISKYGFKNVRSVTLISFAIGLSGLFLGELIFEYNYIILKHDIPFPSIGDFFALLYYVVFLVGLINEVKLAHINWKHFNKRIIILPILFSIVLIGVVSYVGIYQAYDTSETLFANIVAMGYGVGDLILIITSIFLIILVKEYSGGRFAKIWMILLVSFCVSIVGDIFWSFFPTQYHDEVWFYKSFFDTTNMLAYLLTAQALFEFGYSISDAFKLTSAAAMRNIKPITLNTIHPQPVATDQKTE